LGRLTRSGTVARIFETVVDGVADEMEQGVAHDPDGLPVDLGITDVEAKSHVLGLPSGDVAHRPSQPVACLGYGHRGDLTDRRLDASGGAFDAPQHPPVAPHTAPVVPGAGEHRRGGGPELG
jgi:hypothetical protein